jgi:hypothetical protein
MVVALPLVAPPSNLGAVGVTAPESSVRALVDERRSSVETY